MAKYAAFEIMAAVAENYGVTVLVGVRPQGTWFAHADGIEFDGSSAFDAVRSVEIGLKDRTETELRDAERVVAVAKAKLGRVTDI